MKRYFLGKKIITAKMTSAEICPILESREIIIAISSGKMFCRRKNKTPSLTPRPPGLKKAKNPIIFAKTKELITNIASSGLIVMRDLLRNRKAIPKSSLLHK